MAVASSCFAGYYLVDCSLLVLCWLLFRGPRKPKAGSLPFAIAPARDALAPTRSGTSLWKYVPLPIHTTCGWISTFPPLDHRDLSRGTPRIALSRTSPFSTPALEGQHSAPRDAWNVNWFRPSALRYPTPHGCSPLPRFNAGAATRRLQSVTASYPYATSHGHHVPAGHVRVATGNAHASAPRKGSRTL